MKKKTIRKIRSLAFAIVLISIFFINNHNTVDTPKTSLIELNYTVKDSDTVWNIAKAHNFDGKEIRQFVSEIQELNGINGLIRPGQNLIIPVSESGIINADVVATN